MEATGQLNDQDTLGTQEGRHSTHRGNASRTWYLPALHRWHKGPRPSCSGSPRSLKVAQGMGSVPAGSTSKERIRSLSSAKTRKQTKIAVKGLENKTAVGTTAHKSTSEPVY